MAGNDRRRSRAPSMRDPHRRIVRAPRRSGFLAALAAALAAVLATCCLGATARAAVLPSPGAPAVRPSALPGWQQQALERGASTGPSGQGAAMALGEDSSGQGIAFVSNGGGEVLIYGQNTGGTDAWGLAYTLTSSGISNASDHFGWALSFGGGYLAVGDPNAGGFGDDCGNKAGAVTLYEIGADVTQWTLVQTLTVGGHLNNLGSSVAITVDSTGSWLMAGAPGENSCRFISVHGGSAQFAAIWDIGDLSSAPAKFANDLVFGPDGADTALGRAVTLDNGLAFTSGPDGNIVCMIYFDGTAGPTGWKWNGCLSADASDDPTWAYMNNTFGQSLAYSAATGQLLIGVPDNSYTTCSTFGCSSGSSTNTFTCNYLPGEVQVMTAPAGWSSTSPSGGLGTWTSSTLAPPGIQPVQKVYTGANFLSAPNECPRNDWRGPWTTFAPEGTNFGSSLALDASGTFAVVGMPESNLPSGASEQGDTAWAYTLDSSTQQFVEQGSFAPAGLPSDAEYGSAVAIHDTSTGVGQVGVGAPNQSATDGNGYAYLFFDVGRATVGIDVAQVDPAPPLRPLPGSTVTYRSTVTNSAAAPASNLQFAGDPPESMAVSSLTPVSGVTTGWVCGNFCTYAAGDYPAGESTTFEFTVEVGPASPGEVYPMYAVATWDNPSGGMTYASTRTHVAGDATLGVEITQTSSGPVPPGGAAFYEIVVTNTSDNRAGGVVLTVDGLASVTAGGAPPPTIAASSAPDVSGVGCASPSSAPSCAIPTLLPHSSATFTLEVFVPTDAAIGSTFSPQAVVSWENPVDQADSPISAQVTTTIGVGPPTTAELTIVPSPDPPGTVGPQQAAAATLTLTNTGTEDLQVVTVQTSLAFGGGPTYEIVEATLTPLEPGWTCTPYSNTDAGIVYPSCRAAVMGTPSSTFTLSVVVDTAPVGGTADPDVTTEFQANANATWANSSGSIGTPTDAVWQLGPIVPIQITQSPAATHKGDPVTIDVTLPNQGVAPISDLEVVIGPDANHFTYTAGSLTTSPGLFCTYTTDQTFACNAKDLAVGQALSFSFEGVPTHDLVAFLRVASVVIENGDSAPYELTELGAWQLTVDAAADLGLRVADTLAVEPGEVRSAPITGTNAGPDPAVGTHYRFDPDPQLDLQGVTLPGGTKLGRSELAAGPVTRSDWTCATTVTDGGRGGGIECWTATPFPEAAEHHFTIDASVPTRATTGTVEVTAWSDTFERTGAPNTATIAWVTSSDVPVSGAAAASPGPTRAASGNRSNLPATGYDADRLRRLVGVASALIAAGVALQLHRRRRASRVVAPSTRSSSGTRGGSPLPPWQGRRRDRGGINRTEG